MSQRDTACRVKRPQLDHEVILRWADAYQHRHGQWPQVNSGCIPESHGDTWADVYQALYRGYRGLPGGSSLAQLLAEHRGVRNRMGLARLTTKQILIWADAHRHRTGHWPTASTGNVRNAPGETWRSITRALHRGDRGLPGGMTLAQLLARHRGAAHRACMRPLSIPQILHWADAHFRRYRRWPSVNDGHVSGTLRESWWNIDAVLRQGFRGLPGGSSLPQLLAAHRGVRNRSCPPRLTIARILAWADGHHLRTGDWPTALSGAVTESPEDTWRAIDAALRRGQRGLPGQFSLPHLLEKYRGQPNRAHRPRLTLKQILAWADEHQRRTGAWPSSSSGLVGDAPNENWHSIDSALWEGSRGLRGHLSIAKLLEQRRSRRNQAHLPKLTVTLILSWADAHHARTGQWPNRSSGPIVAAPGESWRAIDGALSKGYRGLDQGSSLLRLLAEHRGYRPQLGRRRI